MPEKRKGVRASFPQYFSRSVLGPYSDGWVEITAGGKTSTFKAPSEIGGRDFLESGKETVLNLSLNQGGVGPGEEPEPEPDPDYAGKNMLGIWSQDAGKLLTTMRRP